LNIQSLIEENKDYSNIKSELLAIENKKNKLQSSVDDFKSRLKKMVIDNQSIPNSLYEVLQELENDFSALNESSKLLEEKYNQATQSYNALLEVEHIDIESIIYDRSEEAIEKRVAYNLTLKSIFKGIAIDWLSDMLVLEFKDGTVRYLAEGQRVPTDIPSDIDLPDLE